MRLLRRGGRARARGSVQTTCEFDVYYAGDEPTPPHALVEQQVERLESRSLRRLLLEGSARLEAIYDRGGFCAHPAALASLARESALACGIVPSGDCAKMIDRFFDRLNRAMFTQQTLSWLVDSGLRVEADGSDRHALIDGAAPIAETESSMMASPRAPIQLACGPYGAVSPRVLDEVARGGFFLFRFCPADVIERLYQPICEFCLDSGIADNAQLDDRATPRIRRLLRFADRTLGMDVLRQWKSFVPHVLSWYSHGRSRGAAAIWSDYPTLAFGTRAELLELCRKYLNDPIARRRIAQSMREELSHRESPIELILPNRAAPAMSA